MKILKLFITFLSDIIFLMLSSLSQKRNLDTFQTLMRGVFICWSSIEKRKSLVQEEDEKKI